MRLNEQAGVHNSDEICTGVFLSTIGEFDGWSGLRAHLKVNRFQKPDHLNLLINKLTLALAKFSKSTMSVIAI